MAGNRKSWVEIPPDEWHAMRQYSELPLVKNGARCSHCKYRKLEAVDVRGYRHYWCPRCHFKTSIALPARTLRGLDFVKLLNLNPATYIARKHGNHMYLGRRDRKLFSEDEKNAVEYAARLRGFGEPDWSPHFAAAAWYWFDSTVAHAESLSNAQRKPEG